MGRRIVGAPIFAVVASAALLACAAAPAERGFLGATHAEAHVGSSPRGCAFVLLFENFALQNSAVGRERLAQRTIAALNAPPSLAGAATRIQLRVDSQGEPGNAATINVDFAGTAHTFEVVMPESDGDHQQILEFRAPVRAGENVLRISATLMLPSDSAAQRYVTIDTVDFWLEDTPFCQDPAESEPRQAGDLPS